MVSMNTQRGNLARDIETTKRNQMKILGLKKLKEKLQ